MISVSFIILYHKKFSQVLFLVQNLIPYYFLNQLWPLVFILLGGYLVYHAMQDQKKSASNQNNSNTGEGH